MNTIMSNPVFTALATLGVSGSSRWLSPEFIYPPSDASSGSLTASKSADVFAFAMLAVEVFTGKAPFWDMNGPFIIHIARGERPVKPQAAEQLGLTAELWELIQRCWSADPNARPSIDDVVGAWEGFVNGYVPFSFWSSIIQRVRFSTIAMLLCQIHLDASPNPNLWSP